MFQGTLYYWHLASRAHVSSFFVLSRKEQTSSLNPALLSRSWCWDLREGGLAPPLATLMQALVDGTVKGASCLASSIRNGARIFGGEGPDWISPEPSTNLGWGVLVQSLGAYSGAVLSQAALLDKLAD